MCPLPEPVTPSLAFTAFVEVTLISQLLCPFRSTFGEEWSQEAYKLELFRKKMKFWVFLSCSSKNLDFGTGNPGLGF